MGLGHGGGIVVSALAFYSDNPSSNPVGYLLSLLYEKTKINRTEAGVGPFYRTLFMPRVNYVSFPVKLPLRIKAK